MTIDEKELLKSILDSVSRIDYIKPEDIPSIPLYMEQVTTFMESELKSSRRYEDDKILTKTMINNYTKNDLIPPPDKKKYSKEHVLLLIFIYYFKNILSISDIQTLLHPITDKYFHTKDKLTNFPEEDREFLQQFAFICMLSFDVYVKKQIIEKMVDQMNSHSKEKEHRKKAAAKPEKNPKK